MPAIDSPDFQHTSNAPLPPRDHGAANCAPGKQRRAVLGEIGREAVSASTADSFFLYAARRVAQSLDLDDAGVALVQDDGASLLLQVDSGVRAANPVVASQRLSLAGPTSVWAQALEQDGPRVFGDLARATRPDLAELARAGLAAGIVGPLACGGRPLGAIGVFDFRPRAFDDDEVGFLDSAAMLLAAAAARRQTERALAGQTQFLTTAVDSLEGLVVVLSPSGAIEKFNDACRWMTGFTPEETRGKLFWESLAPADQADAVQDAFDRLRQGEAMARIECPLLRREGGPHRVAWTFTIVQNEQGRLQAIVGSGVEVTRPSEPAEPAVDEKTRKNQAVLAALERCLREGRTPPRAVLDDLLSLQESEELTKHANTAPIGPARRPFPFVQSIAPWNGGRLPSLRSFYEVRCRDISATGFSFFHSRHPDFERMVVALGPGETKVHVIAEVRHVTPYDLDGRPAQLVGCQFLARVYY